MTSVVLLVSDWWACFLTAVVLVFLFDLGVKRKPPMAVAAYHRRCGLCCGSL